MEKTKKFGDNLAMYMHATHNEITPSKLSSRTGIDYKKVRRMMANAELPNPVEFKAILHVFGNKPTDWIRGMSEADARALRAATSRPSEEQAPDEEKPEETATGAQEKASVPDRTKTDYKLSEEEVDELYRLKYRYEKHEITYKELLKEFNASPVSMEEFRKVIGWVSPNKSVKRMRKELKESQEMKENATQKKTGGNDRLGHMVTDVVLKNLKDINKMSKLPVESEVEIIMSKSKEIVMQKRWRSAISMLSDEQAGELLKTIYRYQDDADARPKDKTVALLFEIIRVEMDDSRSSDTPMPWSRTREE